MIELKNITKTYKIGDNIITVLNNINLQVAPGELMALTGPSGAGKSTIMNIVGLLDQPTAGDYYLNGREVSKLSFDALAELRNQTIGFVFQSFFLLPRLTALQNVSLPLTYRRMPTSQIEKQALDTMSQFHIEQLAKHKPNEMSGGQQQRVAIARALVTKPKIILADEPTGNLDSKTSQDVMDLLIDINEKTNTTIIIVTHDPTIAKQCKRTVTVKDGGIM